MKSRLWFRCELCGHRFPIALFGFATTDAGRLVCELCLILERAGQVIKQDGDKK